MFHPSINFLALWYLHTEQVCPLWVLIAGAAVVVGLIVYLYAAQRQIASKKTVAWLTAIRIALIVLLLLLLLRPIVVWEHTEPTPETLWIVLDQSKSMGQVDKQATDLDKLRWADALGLIPPEARSVKLDRADARLKALDQDLRHLRQEKQTGADEKETAELVKQHAEALETWKTSIHDLATHLSDDATFQYGNSAALGHDLQDNADKVAADLTNDKAVEAIHNTELALSVLADKSDNDFLAQHGAEGSVKGALDKVATMRRADIAYGILVGKKRDLPKSLLEVLEHQDTRVVTFAGGQQIITLPSKSDMSKALKVGIEPAGSLTDLEHALEFVANHITNERASVLVISDGRSNEGGDPTEAAKTLGSRGVRVFTLAVGTEELACDASVDSVDVPEWIYKDDTLRVSTTIRLDNLSGQPVAVSFYRGDKQIDQQQLISPGTRGTGANGEKVSRHFTSALTFKDKPKDPGVYEYSIRVQEMPGEVTTQNNTQTFRVNVRDDKINVLLVQDEPRWGDRNIATYIKRDKRVHIQQVLQKPAAVANVTAEGGQKIKASPDNKQEEADLLPETPEEWAAFDLIVLGDVSPEFLTAAQQNNIATAVRNRGSSLLIMAGQFNMPDKFNGMPLAELVPVKPEDSWTADELRRHKKDGFGLQIAPRGVGHVLTQLDPDVVTNTRFRDALESDLEPIGYWHSTQTRAKAVAEVLWRIRENAEHQGPAGADALSAANDRVLLAIMPSGAGRVAYLSWDALWRLNYVYVPPAPAQGSSAAKPELAPNLAARFWGQFIRWVAQNNLPAGGKYCRFGATKARYLDGEPVVVTVRLLRRPDFAPLQNQKFKVIARNVIVKDANGQVKGGGEVVASADAVELPEAPGTYTATLNGLKPGGVEFSLQGDAVENLLKSDFIENAKAAIDDMRLPEESRKSAAAILSTARNQLDQVEKLNDPAAMALVMTLASEKLRAGLAPLLSDEQKLALKKKLDEIEVQKVVQVDIEAGIDREMRNVNADPITLARISRASDGIATAIAYADIVANHIPNHEVPQTSIQTMGLFADPDNPYTKKAHWIFLCVFVVLITAEWIIRKAGGLV